MATVVEKKKKTVRINGCVAAAQAAKYADVDVIAAYPIRPYTATMMALAQMVANGELDAEYIVADSELPDPGQMKEFLPPYKHPYPLDPRHPVSHGPQIMPEQGPPLQLERARAMEGCMPVIEQAHDEFARIFGRRYDAWIEEYMTDGADVVFFLQGAHGVTARHAIRHMRERGAKVGLVRLRTIRPYPTERVSEVLSKLKVVGVVET